MEIGTIIIIILLCGICSYLFFKMKDYKKAAFHTEKINEQTIKENIENKKLLAESQDKLNSILHQINLKEENVNNLQNTIKNLQEVIMDKKQRLKELEEQHQNSDKLLQEKSSLAMENYFNWLEEEYDKACKEYEEEMNSLKNSYSKAQLELLKEYNATSANLDKLKASYAASIEAKVREEKLQADMSFYCLQVKKTDIADIKTLNAMKNELNNPRVLSMLIWQTYFRSQLTSLSNKILGTTKKCGIYKITNQITGYCYIGQSVDIAERWKQHAKCGLGIDTPIGNKLYASMQKDNIWNFSWELLEECSKDQLDEKEKFYIELYQAYEYGYNSTKGNK